MNEYQIRYNRTTTHIDGLTVRTKGSELNYSQNVCGSLTRGGLAVGKTLTTVAEALKAARAASRKVCKNCEAAALAMIEAEEAPVEETAEQPEVTVLVDVVEPGKALVSILGGPAGTLGREGRSWWIEDSYESERIIGYAPTLLRAGEKFAQAMGFEGLVRVRIDYEY